MDSQTEVERQTSLRDAEAQVVAESVQSVEQEQEHRLWTTFAEAATDLESRRRIRCDEQAELRRHLLIIHGKINLDPPILLGVN